MSLFLFALYIQLRGLIHTVLGLFIKIVSQATGQATSQATSQATNYATSQAQILIIGEPKIE